MQRRTAGIIEVPIEADAIGLFLSEAEPGAPRGRRSTAKSAPSGTIFEVVPVGEATTRTSEWEPAPSAVGGHQPARAGRIRRGVLRVGRGIVFLICLPFRAVASVCAAIAAAIRALARGIWRLVTSVGNAVIAAGRALRDVARLGLACIVAVLYLPVRAWAFVATQFRLGNTRVRAWMLRTRMALTTAIANRVSAFRAWVLARQRAVQMAVRAGWGRVVAVAYLPVRAWAFVTAQMRLGVARLRAWMLRTRTMLTTAIVNCVSSCRAWLTARRHAFQMAVRAGWARAVAVAYLPVRAWAFVTAQMRLGVARARAWMLRARTALATALTNRVSAFRAWVLARQRAVQMAVRAGWGRVVAVAYLPVRAWAFVTAQMRLGVARARAWMLRARTALATALTNRVSSFRTWVAARQRASQLAVRAGWARVMVVACLPASASSLVTAQMRLNVARVRAVSRGLVDVVAAGNFAAWRSIEATGRSLQDSGHLLTQALQSSRVRLLVPAGAGVEQVRNRVTRGRSYVRRAGPALSGDAGPAWLLMASTITFFAIASWQQVHQPERSVAPVAAAVPQAKTLVEAVAAIEADPPTVAPALAALSPRPAATLPKPRPVVAKTASPAAAPRVTRTTAATAAGLDALSVPMIWGGVDVRTLQDRLSALARQDVASSRCEVSRSSSTRAKAVCTGLLNSAPQPGNEAKQPRTRSWTIDLLQAEDRWQIVKVAAR